MDRRRPTAATLPWLVALALALSCCVGRAQDTPSLEEAPPRASGAETGPGPDAAPAPDTPEGPAAPQTDDRLPAGGEQTADAPAPTAPPGAESAAPRHPAAQPDTPAASAESAPRGAAATESGPAAAPPAEPEAPLAAPDASEAPAPSAARARAELVQRRDSTISQAIGQLAEPSPERPLSDEDKISLLSELSRQARMQLAGLQTELVETEAKCELSLGRARRYSAERNRLPLLIARGEIPLVYSTRARDDAEDSVTELNALFDEVLERRAEMARALPRYETELAAAREAAALVAAEGALGAAASSATEVLRRRVELASELSALLERELTRIVDATQEAAQFAVDVAGAIEAGEPRRLGARTTRPLGMEAWPTVASDTAVALGWWEDVARQSVDGALRRAFAWSFVLTCVVLVATALLWAMFPRAAAWLARRVGEESLQRRRACRLAAPMVAAGRGLAVAAGWAALCLTWDTPSACLEAGTSLIGAWATFAVFRLALRWALSPGEPELRAVDLREAAAANLHCLLVRLGAYTALLVPLMALLARVPSPLVELSRALQFAYLSGMVAIGALVVHRAGGLSEVLPAPAGAAKTLVHRVGRLALPLCGGAVAASAIAAASGYANLAAFVSRALTLGAPVCLGAVVLDSLVAGGAREAPLPPWKRWFRAMLWCAVVAAAVPILRLRWHHALYAVDLLRHATIDVQGAHVTLLGIVRGGAIVLVSYLVGRRLRDRLTAWPRLVARFQSGAVYALSSLAFYAVLAGGVMWGILASGFDLSVLTVFAGVAGIGLGFGLQDVVRNFVSGLILLIERPVAVGDAVDLGDLQGQVVSISLRSTAIRTRDGNTALVPNSTLASSRVTNMTTSDPRLRVTVEVGVSYDTDLVRARALLLGILGEHELILRDPEPAVTVDRFGDSAIVLRAYAWVGKADDALVTPSQLRFRIWEVFRDEGIRIPFPQRDLHFVTPPAGSAPAAGPHVGPET